MSDVDRLLDEYVTAHRAGSDPDPSDFVGRVEGTDRRELAALIDAFLARAPRRPWDPRAFAASPAGPLVAQVQQELAGEPEAWPALLPRWRAEARVLRRDLVKRLAAALGVAGREEKVARYYHRMEQGLLPPDGISDRVVEALAEILGRPAQAIREAGAGLRSGGEGPAATVFARTALPDAAYSQAPSALPPEARDWDEVDELFRGA